MQRMQGHQNAEGGCVRSHGSQSKTSSSTESQQQWWQRDWGFSPAKGCSYIWRASLIMTAAKATTLCTHKISAINSFLDSCWILSELYVVYSWCFTTDGLCWKYEPNSYDQFRLTICWTAFSFTSCWFNQISISVEIACIFLTSATVKELAFNHY